jgi:seryl-tRNA synthetase
MYDIKWIRENPEAFKEGLRRRNLDSEGIYAELMKLDEQRRANETFAQRAKASINKISAEIGAAKRAGDEVRASELMEQVSRLKSDVTKASGQVADASSAELEKKLAELPNLPLPEVPTGADERGNVERHKFGRKREYKDKDGKAFTPKQHFELGEALGMMDFELAAKLSGARFVVLQKGLARMERALAQFMLDLHTGKHGYTEVNPPLLVRDEVMFGTAQLPKFRDDQFSTKIVDVDPYRAENMVPFIEFGLNFLSKYDPSFSDSIASISKQEDAGAKLIALTKARLPALLKGHEKEYREGVEKAREKQMEEERNLWLIPTAEVPLTNLVRESIVEEDKLPLRLTACTPCFRAEAGAAGKDTRGMIRQHQFTKVELVSITTPEKSKEEHERMLACAEEVLKKLDLHYRVITLCTGDMGFASQKTYDIEVWLPGQNAYREISSCSVCGEFQARRMQARYRGKDGKVKGHVHTLNGSGVAVGRALIAVMETYQQADGSIVVPDVLKPYMGGMTKIERN